MQEQKISRKVKNCFTYNIDYNICMSQKEFESQYQNYEQAFIQHAYEEFEKQPQNNKVQYLR